MAALFASKLSERISVPAAAPFLVVAAVASDLFPRLELSNETVIRVATVALIVILFDGGLSIGWRAVPRLGRADQPRSASSAPSRRRAAPRSSRTTCSGFDWTAAGLLGAAVAPTDPAVMFSVLGDREIGGRTGTILQGESGANDPVGIALMIGMIELAEHPGGSAWIVVREFVAPDGDRARRRGRRRARCSASCCERLSLPSAGLYTLRTLAGAGVDLRRRDASPRGSGFLAVFVAGLLVGDVRAPFKARERGLPRGALVARRDRRLRRARADDLDLATSAATCWLDGLVLAALLAVVIRPLVVWPLLCRRGCATASARSSPGAG